MPHRFRVKVRFAELDPYDHVNHAVYFTYCETARIELLDEIGWGMDKLAEMDRHIVVSEVSARFLAAAELGDELVVETIVDVKRITSRWSQRILRNGEPIVEAELTGAVTDLAGRPLRIPAGLAEALETYRE
ncbi:MAG: acyl-CoA thioesterase [Acidimicrobiia bacterium]